MTHRTVYHPTDTEKLALIHDTGDLLEYEDLINQDCDDEEENVYARALGYCPESEEEVYTS